MDPEQLKVKIQTNLIQSGEYDRLSSQLKLKLAESGWLDDVRRMASEEVSSSNTTNFTKLNQTLEPKALSMVPESVREQTLQQIKEFIEKIVETEQ
ncbi:Sus1p [Cyberlindnera jadinii NRRL Y-1542]|uniref:Transcription and mRNA export factor SUS1 n=1 Tax=Cyberlindnera jadinii (strain ATCC 18201 / CBS 1600 / BCRC 20928 / JCM 3617 / NBRC 0987 / NRRL Y-1542) TaxID=983966 RepID=A0A1E4RU36_CYBJN|nr:Sgf11:sus1 complex [Cyberlindnera jadinii NRRL Y-1542]ODV70789.1 Sgf11:sus1 complex [Cyberlindnera jadinii NRRL Y-1542]